MSPRPRMRSRPQERSSASSPLGDGLALAALLAVCFAAAGIGAVATAGNIDTWYRALDKPPWTPPDATFSIVWPILYAMMAVAAWLVWRQRSEDPAVRAALILFAIQLAINVSWSWAFFAGRSPALGMAVIVALLTALTATIVRFWTTSRLSGWLMVPYLMWVGFAAMLNAAILGMNR